jgi:UDP-N-acetylglucosamine transferase subunit ALG13
MIRAVDSWAAENERRDVFAQIGTTTLRPRNIEWTSFLTPSEFRAKVEAASLLVAHAGMGSILTALELGKPILVMPRRGSLHETRNDHQVATARRFAEQGRVDVAMDELELAAKLNAVRTLKAGAPISRYASPTLIRAIRAFIGVTGDEYSVPDVIICTSAVVPLREPEHVQTAHSSK